MAQQLQQPPAQATTQQYSQIPSQQSQVGQPQSQVGQPQSQVGQQPQGQVGQRTQLGSQPSLQQYEKTMPSEFRVALHDVNTLAEVADWSKDQYLQTGGQQSNVTRTLKDLRDVAELNERFIARDSAYGPQIAEAFLRVARQSLPELQQQQQNPAIDETIPVVQRAIESTEKLLHSVGVKPSQQVGQQTSQLQQVGQQTPQFQQGSQLTPQFQQASQQTPQFQQKTRVGQQL